MDVTDWQSEVRNGDTRLGYTDWCAVQSGREAGDRYQGWANRETWALNLWLSNDEGLSEMTRERVADAMRSFTPYDNDGADATVPREWEAGEAVRVFFEELTDPNELLANLDYPSPTSARADARKRVRDALRMVADVGSAWRIDWREIGAAWLESVDES